MFFRLLFLPLLAFAQDPSPDPLSRLEDWEAAHAAALQAPDGPVRFESLLAAAERHRFAPALQAKALNNYGVWLHRAGRYREAIARLERATALWRGIGDRQSESYASTLNNLADAYRLLNRLSEAEPLYREALELRRGNPSLASTSWNNLGLLYREQHRLPEALDALDRSLGLLHADDPENAATLNNLGAVYQDLRRFPEAEAAYRRAIEIRERQSPAPANGLATVLNNFGSLLCRLERYEEALAPLRRAEQLWLAELGAGHPSLASVWNNLADVYANRGDAVTAEPLYRRAMALAELSLGANHPHTATILDNFGVYLLVQDRPAAAEELFHRALRTSPANEEFRLHLAQALIAQRRLTEAARNLNGLLAALPAEHPTRATVLGQYAVVHLYQEDYARAEQDLREASRHPALSRRQRASLSALASTYAGLLRASRRVKDADRIDAIGQALR